LYLAAGVAIVVTFHAHFTVSVGGSTVDFDIGFVDTSGGTVVANQYLSAKQGNNGLTGDSAGELSITYASEGPHVLATYLRKTSDTGTQICGRTTRSLVRVK
jgi:hypothetical protein